MPSVFSKVLSHRVIRFPEINGRELVHAFHIELIITTIIIIIINIIAVIPIAEFDAVFYSALVIITHVAFYCNAHCFSRRPPRNSPSRAVGTRREQCYSSGNA